MIIGAQMYGYSQIFRDNPEKFLQQMSAYGYQIIEPDLLLEPSLRGKLPPVWEPEELDSILSLMKPLKLSFDSVHIFGDPLRHLPLMEKLRQNYGFLHVVHSVPGLPDIAAAESFAAQCRKEAQALHELGLTLWLHNGPDGVKPDADGKSMLERVLEAGEGEIGMQLDVGWVLYGGVDPAQYLEKLRPWIRSVHYKDMKKGYSALSPRDVHTGLGQGALDVKAVWEVAKTMNATHVLDQDESEKSMMDDARTGIELLRALER